MSRFAGQSKIFGGGDDSSSSESDSSNEKDQKVAETTTQNLNKRSKYMIGSDEEEE